MKIRNGFVSNSSSSSFVIQKSELTPAQICVLENYTDIIRMLPINDESKDYSELIHYGYVDDFWTITDNGSIYMCDTVMDNFNMRKFLTDLGIKCEQERY